MTFGSVHTRKHRTATLVALLAVAAASGCSIVEADTRQIGQALSTGLVISQVYGGGGNSGATYSNDFVELFNRGGVSVSLNGLSIQYASASGTFNSANVSVLPNVSVGPGQYYLIELAAGATSATSLPTPDDVSAVAINLSASNGKVALVNGTTAIACGSTAVPCVASTAGIVDMVGYGASATAFEGTGPGPGPTANTVSVVRLSGGCRETDDNASDFGANDFTSAAATLPRTLATPAHLCTPATDAGSATDTGSTTDTGTDAGTVVDAGTDTGTDAGTLVDAGTDAGTVTDAGSDTGTTADAGTDAGTMTDAGMATDSGIDAGAPTDTGTDATTSDAGSDAATSSDAGHDGAVGDVAVSDAAHDAGRDAGRDAGAHDASTQDAAAVSDSGDTSGGASGCNCSTIGALHPRDTSRTGSLAVLVGAWVMVTRARRRSFPR